MNHLLGSVHGGAPGVVAAAADTAEQGAERIEKLRVHPGSHHTADRVTLDT